MTQLLSYKNDPALKALLLKEIEKHRKADAIVQGTYGDENDKEFKGCAVGCSIHSLNVRLGKNYATSDHSVYETELGIPEWLARLEDRIFEGLPKDVAEKWPGAFTKAIPVGVNLEPIKWRFGAFLLKENIERVLTLKNIPEELKTEVVSAIRGVLVLHENAVETGEWDESAVQSAESAARSAVQSAESAVQSAESAARSAESAVWFAARSARSAVQSAELVVWLAQSAELAARSAESAYIRYSKELLRLLKEAK